MYNDGYFKLYVSEKYKIIEKKYLKLLNKGSGLV